MEEICNKGGVFRVIQCDTADAYYFNESHNEELLPESIRVKNT